MFGLRSYIDKKIIEQFKERKHSLPSGFHPLEQFTDGAECVVTLPWGSERRTVLLRTPSASETADIEKLLKVEANGKTRAQADIEDWINESEKLVKAILISPAYEEIEAAILSKFPVVKEGRDAFLSLEKKYTELANKNKTAINKISVLIGQKNWEDFVSLSKRYGCLLPANFIAAASFWAIGYGKTGAETVTEAELVQSYWLSKQYGGAPHLYVTAPLLDGTQKEYDIKAYQAHEKAKGKKQKVRR